MRFFPTVAAIIALTLFSAFDAQAQRPGSTAAREKAVQLYRKSNEAYNDGKFKEAARLLREAYALDPNPTLLYNLARALESDGDLEGAVEAYDSYLEKDPGAKDAPAIRRRSDNIKAQLKEREELRQRAVEQEREQERRRLEQSQGPGDNTGTKATKDTTTTAEITRPHEPSVVPWIVAGVGGAGIAVGAVFGAMASGKHGEANDEPVQETAATLDEDARSLATLANVAYISGGVLVAVGVIWGIIDASSGPSAEPSASMRVGFAPLQGGGALSVVGSF